MIVLDDGSAIIDVSSPILVKNTGGNAVLSGNTLYAGTPDAPVARVVQLFEGDSFAAARAFPAARLVAQALSAQDGAWAFAKLDPTVRYHVIAYDHTGQYDPVIKLNLIPTVPA